jgi:hypothetical protein
MVLPTKLKTPVEIILEPQWLEIIAPTVVLLPALKNLDYEVHQLYNQI